MLNPHIYLNLSNPFLTFSCYFVTVNIVHIVNYMESMNLKYIYMRKGNVFMLRKGNISMLESSKEEEWLQIMEMTEAIRLFASQYIKKTAKGAPYSAQEVDALFRIELGEKPVTPIRLSLRMGISKSAVSRLIEQIQSKGLIQKNESEKDKRSYSLELTENGRRVLKSAYFYYVEPISKLEKKLGKNQCRELFRLIAICSQEENPGEENVI